MWARLGIVGTVLVASVPAIGSTFLVAAQAHASTTSQQVTVTPPNLIDELWFSPLTHKVTPSLVEGGLTSRSW